MPMRETELREENCIEEKLKTRHRRVMSKRDAFVIFFVHSFMLESVSRTLDFEHSIALFNWVTHGFKRKATQ